MHSTPILPERVSESGAGHACADDDDVGVYVAAARRYAFTRGGGDILHGLSSGLQQSTSVAILPPGGHVDEQSEEAQSGGQDPSEDALFRHSRVQIQTQEEEDRETTTQRTPPSFALALLFSF
uniref:Squalene monooxygenase-like n=1 Tax=Rhizophora mucronata TaxID=61149 RepID=A0A2P2MPQ6_RHIMU